MTKEELESKPKNEILNFIKDRLKIKTSKDINTQEELHTSTSENLNLLNKFADLGIYERTQFLVLDYKTLYLQYNGHTKEEKIDLSNLDTSEIIYTVFEKTIFLNRKAS